MDLQHVTDLDLWPFCDNNQCNFLVSYMADLVSLNAANLFKSSLDTLYDQGISQAQLKLKSYEVDLKFFYWNHSLHSCGCHSYGCDSRSYAILPVLYIVHTEAAEILLLHGDSDTWWMLQQHYGVLRRLD